MVPQDYSDATFPEESGEGVRVLARVESQHIWIAVCNFCSAGFLFTILQQSAFFVIRQHGGLGYEPVSKLYPVGFCETGTVFEQQIEIVYEGQTFRYRRIDCSQVK